MKIGQFAKKHNVTASTVRFYIKLGLLIPQKKGTQHVFTADEDAEMELIKELKTLGYSLKEMQKYVSTVRLYQKHDSALTQSLLALLADKEQHLLQKRDEIEMFIERVRSKISTLKEADPVQEVSQDRTRSTAPVTCPLDFIPLLQCPDCESSLQMKNAEIINSGIRSAKLQCTCGYHSEIRNGMLFTGKLYDYEADPDFSRCFFGTYKEISDIEDIFFESSSLSTPELMILQHKALLYIQENIRQLNADRHIIIFPDISCHQLYKLNREPYIENSLIIVPTFSPASIVPIQKHLCDLGLKILYIVNHDGNLPFPKESADAVIDYTGICNFSFFNRTPFMELFSPYVKKGAWLMSFTEYYDDNAKSLDIIKDTYKFSNPAMMTWKGLQNSLAACGFKLTQSEILGTCSSPGEYWEYHHPNDKRHAVCYRAEKL